MINQLSSYKPFFYMFAGLSLSGMASAEFEDASVIFEQNATDGDAEAVFAMKGGDEGIETLLVLGPNNRVLINVTTVSGMREYLFESPEPEDVDEVKALYPEGNYLFFGTTPSGVVHEANVTLSHDLPETSSFISPAEEATGVPLNVTLSWTAVPGVVNYIIELENDDLGEAFTTTLQSAVTSLQVPGGFLMANTEYEIQIGTVGANGNKSFVETSFTTGN